MKYLPVVDDIPPRGRSWAVDVNYVQDCWKDETMSILHFYRKKPIVHLWTTTYNYVNLFILIAIGNSFFNVLVKKNLP